MWELYIFKQYVSGQLYYVYLIDPNSGDVIHKGNVREKEIRPLHLRHSIFQQVGGRYFLSSLTRKAIQKLIDMGAKNISSEMEMISVEDFIELNLGDEITNAFIKEISIDNILNNL